MKKVCLLAVAIAMMAAVNVGATSVTVSRVSGYYANGFGGGEFNISPKLGAASLYSANAIVNGGFETFCIQTSVTIAIPGTYNASLSQADSQGTKLTQGAAWLYVQFAEGILSQYDYSPTLANGTFSSRGVAAEYLQNTIWELQGQSYTASLASYYYGVVTTAIGSANVGLANNGKYGAADVNMTTSTGAPVQNMLALVVPDGGSTAILLGLALSGMGLMFVRKAKRA